MSKKGKEYVKKEKLKSIVIFIKICASSFI